ncbi:Tropomodulin-2 [Symbiodinium microadriaticum]|uniref:Tropomodulin-2 n=1 Tax=Symbiodinium microadriaticum TaxID=2951 RepID=A0A1Q9CE20_SYMMI|nr:Tropomodulin-2 [Symbiodinium microadriaticum]
MQLAPKPALKMQRKDEFVSRTDAFSLTSAIVQGSVSSFAVEPALPEGVSLDETTGAITGAFGALCGEQTYVVTASGEDGHTSAELSFAVVLPAPKNLTYPMASPSYAVGEPMSIEPDLEGSEGCTFAVEPSLPEGLVLDPATGVISGQPVAESAETTYVLSASNASGSTTADLTFQVQEVQTVDAAGIDQKLAAKIEAIEDISDMIEEPAKAKSFGDWMIWMVHRAHLDDPTLTDFDFSNLHMPRGDLEERIAPKLAKAMAWNTNIQTLSLVNSNLQKAEGVVLAQSLKTNKTLLHLNLENNCLDSASVKDLATNLMENPSSKIETLRVAQQKQVGNSFGRPVEEAFGHLLEKNEAILRLGFFCSDAHWRNLIDRAVLRNNDFARRRRKRNMGEEEEEVPAEEKPLSRLLLKTPPAKPASELLPEGEPAHAAVRGFLILHRKFPTSTERRMSLGMIKETEGAREPRPDSPTNTTPKSPGHSPVPQAPEESLPNRMPLDKIEEGEFTQSLAPMVQTMSTGLFQGTAKGLTKANMAGTFLHESTGIQKISSIDDVFVLKQQVQPPSNEHVKVLQKTFFALSGEETLGPAKAFFWTLWRQNAEVMLRLKRSRFLCNILQVYEDLYEVLTGKEMLSEDDIKVGTDQYIAPEAYEGTYSQASDVFAVGVIAHKVFDDKPGENYVGSPKMHEIADKLRQADLNWEKDFKENGLAADFCKQLMSLEPEDRPSADEAISTGTATRRLADSCRVVDRCQRQAHLGAFQRQGENASIPGRSQLQTYAKNNGMPMKFVMRQAKEL